MLEKAKITPKQLIALVVVSRLVISFSFYPGLDGPPGNQDVWISMIIAIFIHLLLSVPVYYLWKRFPSQSLVQYSQTILGKAGKLIGILYILYFLHNIGVFLCEWCTFLTSAVMPETPPLFLSVFLLALSAYAVSKGIEVISRWGELIVPIVFLALITIFLLLTKEMNLNVFTPMMERSFPAILAGGVIIPSRTLEILVLAMFLPYLNVKKVKTVFIVSFAIIGLFMLLLTVNILSVLGVELTRISQFPYFTVIRLVDVADFIERIESIHMAIWILCGFLRTTLYLYIIVIGLSQVFNLKSYKPLIVPTVTIIVPLTMVISVSIVELKEFLSYKISTLYDLLFILIIPSFLLLIAIIRKQGERIA